jgi:hypothetical protein
MIGFNVDGADLLGAQPGEGDLVVAFIGVQGSSQAGALPVGQSLGVGVQEVADAVERVALAAAVAVDLLLDAAAALVQRLGCESDDVKGVEHRDGVVELVIDRVLVAVKGVEGGNLDRGPERVTTLLQPVGVDAARPSGDQVQQSRSDVSVLVRGQVDHAGELLGSAPTLVNGLGRDVMPDVLIDPKDAHPGEPRLLRGRVFAQRADGAPHRPPRRPQLTRQPLHAGVLATQLADSPPGRPRG